MSEAVLKAFGVHTCGDLIAKRGLLGALFSDISTDFFMEVVRKHPPPRYHLCEPAVTLFMCACDN